jgi:hypothetical protein
LAPHFEPISIESHCEKLRAPSAFGADFHQAAVAVVGMPGRDALADDRAAGVFPEVDHLGAGVGLLFVVGQRHRVELADRVVAEQHAGRILPGDRRAGLDLGPGNLRIAALAQPALGDEVVDAADAVLVAGIPVLHRRILDVGVVQRHQLHHRRVQLVGVELGRGAALEIGHLSALLGNDQRALELARILGVDAEIGRQSIGHLTPFGMKQNEPSVNTAELSAA